MGFTPMCPNNKWVCSAPNASKNFKQLTKTCTKLRKTSNKFREHVEKVRATGRPPVARAFSKFARNVWCFWSLLKFFLDMFGVIYKFMLAPFLDDFSGSFLHPLFDTVFDWLVSDFWPSQPSILVLAPNRRAIFRVCASSRNTSTNNPNMMPNRSPNGPRNRSNGPKRASQGPPKDAKKTKTAKDPKNDQKRKTCLSKWTGSAFKAGAL